MKCLDQGHTGSDTSRIPPGVAEPIQRPAPDPLLPPRTDESSQGESSFEPKHGGQGYGDLHHIHISIPDQDPLNWRAQPSHQSEPHTEPYLILGWLRAGPCSLPALPPWSRPSKPGWVKGTPVFVPPTPWPQKTGLDGGPTEGGPPPCPHLSSHGLTPGPLEGPALGAREDLER